MIFLYVDDEEGNTLVFTATFEEEFEIVVAHSAAEALALAARGSVGVLIADQRMPGLSGVDLCERFAETSPDTVRVLLTAYSDPATVLDAINRGGVRRFLTKPWNAAEMRGVLQDLLAHVTMQRTIAALRERVAREQRREGVAAGRALVSQSTQVLADAVVAACGRLTCQVEGAAGQLPRMRVDVLLGEIAALAAAAVTAREALADAGPSIVPPLGERGVGSIDAHTDSVIDAIHLAVGLTEGSVSRNATIRTDVPPDLRMRADRMVVARIVGNLLTNAATALRDAGRTDGVIVVGARSHGGLCEIVVSDDGPGVPPGNRERIFTPLFTTWEKHGGTGLGLAMSADLARSCGGELVLGEPSEGGGARFVLRVLAGACMR